MVLIWTNLARGDREMATVLVALNAVFQVLLYSVLGFFYLQVLPGWLGLRTASLHVSMAIVVLNAWDVFWRPEITEEDIQHEIKREHGQG